MKKTLRIDSVGGASGDMLLSALAAVGADLAAVQERIRSLLPDSFEIVLEDADSHGLHGKRASVIIDGTLADSHHDHEKSGGHHHHHHHDHQHARGLKAIGAILDEADLSGRVRDGARDAFTRIAVAEAEIHGTTPEKVHFHEVGAVDAIVDIVGVHLAVEQLGVDAVRVGPLPLGQGTMHCAHGTMPIPAPATARILEGHDVIQTEEPFELVTPTGAALLMSLKSEEAPSSGRFVANGFGFGRRQLSSRPNALRASLLACDADTTHTPTACLLLEANIDDSTPEWLGALIPHLLDAGALDAWLTPIVMKKGRPAHCLSALCSPEKQNDLEKLIFTETTTFGIRRQMLDRTVLNRRFETVNTPYGPIPVKIGLLGDIQTTRTPEHDACAAAATEYGVSIREVWLAAMHSKTSN